MGYKYIDVAPTVQNAGKKAAYEAESSLAAAGNGDWILMPADIQNIAVTVSVGGGGAGKVQTSTDKVATIISGSGIVAIDWSAGAVSANTADKSAPVTAMRLVQTSVGGTTKMTIRAQ